MKHFAIRKLSKILTLLLLIISGKLCYGDTVSIPFRYYQYDALNGNSWNRMQKITYPDGEVVTYGYDGGGNLLSMNGTKKGTTTNYIRKIHYNEQGKRNLIVYGNGVETQYTYDSRMRLNTLMCTDSSNNILQSIKYTYDNVDNITKVVNSGGTVNTLGGSYTYTHAYDALNRLTKSTGTYKNAGSYSLDMAYSSAGRVSQKVNTKLSQDLYYNYCSGDKPHAPRLVVDKNIGDLTNLRWDAMGNLGQIDYYDKDGVYLHSRHIGWTEDSRITNIVDKSYHSYYAYDDAGERVLKITGPSTILDVNADMISYQSTLKNVTLYTSPYLVAHNKGYTKHFYAGSERVCAAIGEGGLNNLVPCIGNDQTLKNKTNNLFYNTIGAMGDRLLLENDECLRNDKNTPKELLAEFENVAVNVQLSSGVDAGTFHNAIDKYCSQDNANSAVYYYHSDHLGSASWITNTSGSPVQHLQYMPYGELFVNERTGSYEERFTFTGKERDSETGFSYFGARYYDSDLMTGWLSVDPMADKYPNISPYAYCAWNPVKLVDPDGEEISPIYDTDGNFLGTDDKGLQGEALIMNKTDFRQGMSNEEAKSKGRTLDNMSDKQALKFANNGNFKEFLNHYNSLSSRPDWDGYLSLFEANDWYSNGNGESLYVDAAQISLFPVTTGTFDKGEGSRKTINFLGKYFNPPTGLVYGQIQLTLLDGSTGEVKLGRVSDGFLDNYGFEQHPNGSRWRNFATKIGSIVAGEGKSFNIYTYNNGSIWH